MEAKHTPGPWVANDDFIRGTDSGREMAGYEYIAKVETEFLDSPVDRKHANARLIAAAPELLEALQRMVANNMPLTENPTNEQLIEFWEYEKSQGRGEADDMLFVLATIARATGTAS